mgnify:CR=1 FL=1
MQWALISVFIIWAGSSGDEIKFMPHVSLPVQTQAECLKKKAEVKDLMTDRYHSPNFAGHLLKCVQINRLTLS